MTGYNIKTEKNNEMIMDAIRGSLIGGAAGDALGYPVEFYRLRNICQLYGKNGIMHYKLNANGEALLSDDTQMTLFTAIGLISCMTGESGAEAPECIAETSESIADPAKNSEGFPICTLDDIPEMVWRSYCAWYDLQTGQMASPHRLESWLCKVPQMASRRAPGNTCLSSLGSGKCGSIGQPLNHRKGCGGVMRVAPVGLALNRGSAQDRIDELDKIAAQVAAITHGHPLGYLPAAALAHIVNRIVYWDLPIVDAVWDSIEAMERIFADENCSEDLDYMLGLMEKAMLLTKNGMTDAQNISFLGEGWVAEETLAISIYCAVKYPEDFSRAIIAAVNHDGDSDSTGAVTGNIVGAAIGYQALPDEWKKNLECKDVILKAADELFRCPDISFLESSPNFPIR